MRATFAVLYCAAVGCMNNCWNCCSAVLGCSACRCLFFEVVVIFCFFWGHAVVLTRLRLYMMSCCRCTLSVVVVPHFFHSWSRPSASCRSCSHLTVCLCSVSSTLIRVGRLLGVSCRLHCVASFRRSSVSASLFRSSQTLCECWRQVSSMFLASVGRSRGGVPLATASAVCCCVRMPMRIAVRFFGLALSFRVWWIEAGVSGRGLSNTGC